MTFEPMKLIQDLHMKNRALVSDGFDESLDYIGNIIPLKVLKFKSGEMAQTWRIPKKWIVNEAYIEMNGKRIIDIANHPLHLYSYSQPFQGTVSKSELLEHITTDPDRPDLIPYRFVFYQNVWGFCMKHSDLSILDADEYQVRIDTVFEDGELKIGQYEKKGVTDQVILIPVHLDHPGQCNDNLSGVSVAVMLAQHLMALEKTLYTYRLLFLPETIGAMAYLEHHRDHLEEFKYGLVVDSVGHDNSLFMMKSLKENTKLDRICSHVMRHRYEDAQAYSFLDPRISSFSNDERALQGPGFEIPTVAFSRAPYDFYHSSHDDPGGICEENLQDTFNLILEVMEILETDYVPKRNYDGVPFLSGYDLWDHNWKPEDINRIERLLFHLDNKTSIFEIAKSLDCPYRFVHTFIMNMSSKDLLTR